jgi:hypothetical protein
MSKDTNSFKSISPRITVAPSTVPGIAQALATAIKAADKRNIKSGIDWPTTPDEAFPNSWISRFVAMSEQTLHSPSGGRESSVGPRHIKLAGRQQKTLK